MHKVPHIIWSAIGVSLFMVTPSFPASKTAPMLVTCTVLAKPAPPIVTTQMVNGVLVVTITH